METFKVMLADDSPAMRKALSGLLEADPRFSVAAQACDGEQAVSLGLSCRPDLVVMDAVMPGLDGLKATQRILASLATRVVLISSALADRELDVAFRGLQAGAMEVMAKPAPGQDLLEWGNGFRDTLWRLAQAPLPGPGRQRGGAARQWAGGFSLRALALVASTGGPPVLARILGLLPPGLPLPIFVAQHLAPGFSSGLARWMAHASGWQVRLAEEGGEILPGRVYLAPDGCDLAVDRQGRLATPANTSDLLPSGNRLLESLAAHYGAQCGAALLTGMGEDGAAGLLALRRAGGLCLAQDPDSCAVFGMPKAALDLGAAAYALSPEDIARCLLDGAATPRP